MHQSRMFSNQSNHFRFCVAGMIRILPSVTASQASAAICLQSTHHCGLRTGSMTSLVREESPSLIPGFGLCPLYRPASFRSLITSYLADHRFIPLYLSPQPALSVPSSFRMLTNSSLCFCPVTKSLGSCAGVILTAPVPKSISTRSASRMIGMRRFVIGWMQNLPWYFLYLSSSGCTATAVSPSIVSGRVVAMTSSSSLSSTLYAHSQKSPKSTFLSQPGRESFSGCSRVM
mmetsp:Transcript_23455/g.54523  ORF Transcript_23455/g.54523 Transcript_23455/m.54523 type:complete len:231 (-) Transcript_23455:804-1496(-)